MLVEQGSHPRYVADQLGHSSAKTTMDRYSHLFPSTYESESAKLEDTIFGRAGQTSAVTKGPPMSDGFRSDDDPDFRDEELEFEPHMSEAEIAALRRILGRVAVLLRQGKVEPALAEIPVTEHEVFAERLMGSDLPPRGAES